MSDIELTIDFLEKRARLFIGTTKQRKAYLFQIYKKLTNNELMQTNSIQMHHLVENQVVFNQIIKMLCDITFLKNCAKNKGEDWLREQFDLYSKSCVEKTVTYKMEYNYTHPLYGFDIFEKQLIAYYSEIEDYEMCHYILNKQEIKHANENQCK